MTDAERALWRVLGCRQVSGLKFRRQHPFDDYVLDFVCLENKLVIEVDGGQHGKRAKEDEIRTQKLLAAGFRVLRVWNNQVLQEIEAVKERIWKNVILHDLTDGGKIRSLIREKIHVSPNCPSHPSMIG